LNSHITSKDNPFLSKDSFSSVFKSKESFSDLYSGKEWDLDNHSNPKLITKTSQPIILKSQGIFPKVHESVDWDAVMATAEALARDSVTSLPTPSTPKPAPFSDAFKSSDWSIVPEAIPDDLDYSPDMLDALLPEPAPVEKKAISAFQSREWVMNELLGSHEDVALSPEMFSLDPEPVEAETSPKTDWGAVMMSQIAPSSPSAEASTTAQPTTKKRKRKKRKKVVPENMVYVQISDLDVLLGRGGRSNHHPGNKRYREEVENFRRVYGTLETDAEKTETSQLLVDCIEKMGGRFLEENKEAGKSMGWYVVPNIVARRKASQALREDNDPEKRKAKRARFLAKKKAAEPLC